MKKLMSFVAILFAMVNFGWAQVPTNTSTAPSPAAGIVPAPVPVPSDFVDAEQAAMEYLSKGETVRYYGGFNSQLQKQGFPSKDERAQFILEEGKITYMMINGIVIVDVSRGDQPLSGFYPPSDGYLRTNFGIWASGQDAQTRPTLYGWAHYDQLQPGQAISIALVPQASMRIISRPADVNVTPWLEIVFPNGGGGGYYDKNIDSFVVWIEPFQTTPPKWEIIDTNSGAVLASGTITFLHNGTQTRREASVINFTTMHGAKPIVFDSYGNYNLSNQTLDGWTNAKGEPIPAETYFVDLKGQPLYIQSQLPFVVKLGDTGQYVDQSQFQDGYHVLQLIPGFDKITITVTGSYDQNNGFWVHFTTNPGPGKG